MISNKLDAKNIKLNQLLKFKSKEEKLEFDAVIIHLNIMHQIQKLLDNKKMSHADLASALNVSEAFVSKLFSGDKLLNLEKIAQIQNIFGTKFQFHFSYNTKKNSSKKKSVQSKTSKLNVVSSSPSIPYSLTAKSGN
ncbi:MAG: helix-turn-helix transcriptional regulator [Bacteroidota bacterium]